jgi:hypothetical protein
MSLVDEFKTEKVKFYIGQFENKEKRTGLIVNDKPDLVLTIKQIFNNNFSLNYTDYVKEKETLIKGIEYKKIEEIFDIKKI